MLRRFVHLYTVPGYRYKFCSSCPLHSAQKTTCLLQPSCSSTCGPQTKLSFLSTFVASFRQICPKKSKPPKYLNLKWENTNLCIFDQRTSTFTCNSTSKWQWLNGLGRWKRNWHEFDDSYLHLSNNHFQFLWIVWHKNNHVSFVVWPWLVALRNNNHTWSTLCWSFSLDPLSLLLQSATGLGFDNNSYMTLSVCSVRQTGYHYQIVHALPRHV